MNIAIAADHGGFSLMQELLVFLAELGHDLQNLGPDSADSVDYPDYAKKVALAVAEGRAECGILICGTGIGMAIAANKIPGIRAATVTSPEFASLTREHNNTNVLALSGRFVDVETNKSIVRIFLETDFEGGRHQRRVDKISDLENR
ncbi:MAG: ribose 5-phosphate isomerase B [Coriobacteriales bacterium]|nr:ribose 5-phosphate isomerase B [Coriobacteriales bacterium]